MSDGDVLQLHTSFHTLSVCTIMTRQQEGFHLCNELSGRMTLQSQPSSWFYHYANSWQAVRVSNSIHKMVLKDLTFNYIPAQFVSPPSLLSSPPPSLLHSSFSSFVVVVLLLFRQLARKLLSDSNYFLLLVPLPTTATHDTQEFLNTLKSY